jgi:hypothetical protein
MAPWFNFHARLASAHHWFHAPGAPHHVAQAAAQRKFKSRADMRTQPLESTTATPWTTQHAAAPCCSQAQHTAGW